MTDTKRPTITRTASSHGQPRPHRIPLALQTVFLKSNRGKEVSKPPPQQIAQKVFTRNWGFRRSAPTPVQQVPKKVYERSKDKLLSENRKNSVAATAALAAKQQQEEAKADAVLLAAAAAQKEKEQIENYTLEEYFEALLKERGYNPQYYNTLETGYYNVATPYQIASYGPRMVTVVKSSDALALRETLMAGLSPNPCNKFGESLLHMVCRRGDLTLLNVMVEAGAVIQVADDYGRTPLHDACWAANPAFEVVKVLLKRDPFLFFMKDKRGSLPLTYVHKADWAEWRNWLDGNIDIYFPENLAETFCASDLCGMAANSFPLPEYKNELSLELIAMVANGDLSPREARMMAEAGRREDEETVADTLDDSDSDDSDSDYDSDSDCDSECSEGSDADFDMEEGDLLEMLQLAQKVRA